MAIFLFRVERFLTRLAPISPVHVRHLPRQRRLAQAFRLVLEGKPRVRWRIIHVNLGPDKDINESCKYVEDAGIKI